MKLYYLDNSGFAVLLQDSAIIFDCWNFPADMAGALLEKGYLQKDVLAQKQRVYLCISHTHGDHFNKEIFAYAKVAPYTMVVADADVPVPAGIPCALLRPGESFDDGYACFHAWDSTDIGISLQVEVEGKRIFHAGDLNDWHWEQECTPEEICEMHEAFVAALDAMTPSLAGGLDLAFFPVDPRMITNIEAGALLFAGRFAPKWLVPMHFSNRFEIVAQFAQQYAYLGNIWAPTRRGDSCNIEI